MDSSKSKPSHPCSDSGSGDSTGAPIPPVENNPPEQSSHDGGSSSSKRKKSSTDCQPEEEESVDITGLSTPSKRHQTESSTANENTDDSATGTSSLRRNDDLILLVDIDEFQDKTGSDPFANLDDLQEFYDQWSEGHVVFKNVLEVKERLVELNSRFLINIERKSNGEDVEGEMDPIDNEIFQISNVIWGKEDDHGVNDSNDSKQETEDDQDRVDYNASKDSSEEKTGDDHDGVNPNDSKDSSTKDSKESSKQETSGDHSDVKGSSTEGNEDGGSAS